MAAADALTSSLIRGFGDAASAVAKFAGGTRQVLLQLGIGDPVTQQETIDKRSRSLDNNRFEIKRLESSIPFSGENSEFVKNARERIKALQAEKSCSSSSSSASEWRS